MDLDSDKGRIFGELKYLSFLTCLLMQQSTRALYSREIRRQCSFALDAAKDYQACLAVYPWEEEYDYPDPNRVEKLEALTRAIYRHAHSFLTHTGNVSKIFWPVANKKQTESLEQLEARVPRMKRGRILRKEYELPCLDVLANRQLRDHFEHFDERIDSLAALMESKGDNLNLMDAMLRFTAGLYKEYSEEESGGGTAKRTQFQQLFADAYQLKFDEVLFWSLDRFSREGVGETLHHLQRLHVAGCRSSPSPNRTSTAPACSATP